MPAAKAHSWTFRSRFRASAFGWRSDLPIKRIKEAVAEIKKASRRDKVLGAEGAVIFLEKVSGALEHVDSSSGAIGTAVNRAIRRATTREMNGSNGYGAPSRMTTYPISSCSPITGAN